MKELQHLILSGESDTLDFKKRITDAGRIARTLASFANTRGGIILVGVMDNGQISGIDPEEEKHTLTLAANCYCKPPVKMFFKELEAEDEKTVLKIIIPESAEKPHLVKVNEDDWREYIRIKDETVQTDNLLEKARVNETTEKVLPVFDAQEIALLNYLKLNQRINLQQFMKLVNISRKRANGILVRMVLLGSIRIHEKANESYFTL